jgi:hypothetical protein
MRKVNLKSEIISLFGGEEASAIINSRILSNINSEMDILVQMEVISTYLKESLLLFKTMEGNKNIDMVDAIEYSILLLGFKDYNGWLSSIDSDLVDFIEEYSVLSTVSKKFNY